MSDNNTMTNKAVHLMGKYLTMCILTSGKQEIHNLIIILSAVKDPDDNTKDFIAGCYTKLIILSESRLGKFIILMKYASWCQIFGRRTGAIKALLDAGEVYPERKFECDYVMARVIGSKYLLKKSYDSIDENYGTPRGLIYEIQDFYRLINQCL